MSQTSSRTESQLLADRIEEHLTAIPELVSVIREDQAFDGCEPGPRLSPCQVDALHFAIHALGKAVLGDFHNLMNLLEVPA
jgi:hypothetical protein